MTGAKEFIKVVCENLIAFVLCLTMFVSFTVTVVLNGSGLWTERELAADGHGFKPRFQN